MTTTVTVQPNGHPVRVTISGDGNDRVNEFSGQDIHRFYVYDNQKVTVEEIAVDTSTDASTDDASTDTSTDAGTIAMTDPQPLPDGSGAVVEQVHVADDTGAETTEDTAVKT